LYEIALSKDEKKLEQVDQELQNNRNEKLKETNAPQYYDAESSARKEAEEAGSTYYLQLT